MHEVSRSEKVFEEKNSMHYASENIGAGRWTMHMKQGGREVNVHETMG